MAIENIRITSFKAEYSDNLLPKETMFNESGTFNILAGGSYAVVERSTERHFNGIACAKMTCLDSGGELVWDYDGFNTGFTAEHTGNYIVSARFFVPDVNTETNFSIKTFVNGIAIGSFELYANLYFTSQDFTYGEWNTYAQSIQLNAGQTVTFQFKYNSDSIGNRLYFSGMKLEYDDRALGIPSIFSNPKNYSADLYNGYVKRSAIGWASYVDTLHTSGSPQTISEGLTPVLLTNNSGTVISSQLPDGVVKLFDSATTKITPVQENDFNSVDIMFTVKNSVTNGFFTVYVDIPTLGTRFEQLFVCPKTAGTAMGVNYSFHHYVSSQFAANGGTIYIVANSGNLQIYDKQYRFSKLINAK